MIPPTAPSRPIEATSAVRPPLSSTVRVTIVWSDRKQARLDLLPAPQDQLTGRQFNALAEGLDQRRAPLARKSTAIDCRKTPRQPGLVRRLLLLPRPSSHWPALLLHADASGTRLENALLGKLLHQPWTGLDRCDCSDKQTVRDQAEGSDIDQAFTAARSNRRTCGRDRDIRQCRCRPAPHLH